MATKILQKRGTGIPSAGSLSVGELAIDTSNGKVYTKIASGEVVEVGGGGGGGSMLTLAPTPTTVSGLGYKKGQDTPTNDVVPGYSGSWKCEPKLGVVPGWIWGNSSDGSIHGQIPSSPRYSQQWKFTVPTGKVFALMGLGVNPDTVTTRSEFLMNSMRIDGVDLYPGSTLRFEFNYSNTVGSGIVHWPGFGDALSTVPYRIEKSIEWQSKRKQTGSGFCDPVVFGYFVDA